MNRKVMAAVAVAVISALGIFGGIAHASQRVNRPEPAICGPVTALIEYWLPVVDKTTVAPAVPGAPVPKYPWVAAATEIFAVSQYAPKGLSFYAEAVGATIGTLGAGSDPAIWHPHLRADLAAVRAACPSLPASVVNGPLPR